MCDARIVDDENVSRLAPDRLGPLTVDPLRDFGSYFVAVFRLRRENAYELSVSVADRRNESHARVRAHRSVVGEKTAVDFGIVPLDLGEDLPEIDQGVVTARSRIRTADHDQDVAWKPIGPRKEVHVKWKLMPRVREVMYSSLELHE